MRYLIGAAAVLVLVAACAPAPSVTAPATAPSPSAAAVATATPVATPATATERTSPTPTPDVDESTGPLGLSDDEQWLIARLREDAAVDCTPRRTDLPPRALAGVECRPDSDLVARVGIYGFRDERDAALSYLERLASAGVTPNSGDCIHGIPGETAWTPGDGEGSIEDDSAIVVDGQALVRYRSGCFHDENGTANYRATCWGLADEGVYVGVLGRGRDLAALEDWAWMYPEGVPQGTPSQPGICSGQVPTY